LICWFWQKIIVEFITRRIDVSSIHNKEIYGNPPSYQKSLWIRRFVEFITPSNHSIQGGKILEYLRFLCVHDTKA